MQLKKCNSCIFTDKLHVKAIAYFRFGGISQKKKSHIEGQQSLALNAEQNTIVSRSHLAVLALSPFILFVSLGPRRLLFFSFHQLNALRIFKFSSLSIHVRNSRNMIVLSNTVDLTWATQHFLGVFEFT